MLELGNNPLTDMLCFSHIRRFVLCKSSKDGYSAPSTSVSLCSTNGMEFDKKTYSVHSFKAINSFFRIAGVTRRAPVSGEASFISAKAVTEFATTYGA